ncbi:MAG TPA: cytochrome P450 [Saprospiraceae bacterium]|nr:cytochrome P450 [Saprospiraceae bacterium]
MDYHYPPLVPRYISLFNALRMVQNPIPILSNNLKRYGKSYTFHIGGLQKGIVTTEPAFIQHVLQKNHRNYRKSKIQTDILGHYIGQGLLTSDGAYWLRQRRLIQPAFHRDKLEHLIRIMAEEVNRYFSTQWQAGQTVDMYREMHTLAFRVVAKSLFGTNVSEELLRILSENITIVQRFITRRIRQPYLHPWFVLSGIMRKHDIVSQHSHDLLRQVIRARKESGEVHNDLLDLLLSSRYEDTGELMNEQQVLEESLILFIAGHETSANALTWCFYLLSQHPEWCDAVRNENVIPATTIAELMQLNITRQVISETMRIYPPAWIIDRLSNDEDEILGFSYPKDTFTIQYIYGVHHDEDLWPDPEHFDPGRFAADKVKDQIPFSYLPFGGGPRLCIGNQFAMLEMLLVISYVVRHYQLKLAGDHPVIQPLVTLRPKGSVLMKLMSL